MGTNSSSVPPSPPPSPSELEKPWRKVPWGKNSAILQELGDFQSSLDVLRILVIEPVGAGKSSFINSVQRALLGRNFIGALKNSLDGTSFTSSMKSFQMKKCGGGQYPFQLIDIMGFQTDVNNGVHTGDIIEIMEGHILDGYIFNPQRQIHTDGPYYNQSPSLCDRVHCLVNILPGSSLSFISEGTYDKLKNVREKASELGIPQVIVLTNIDKICGEVDRDVKKIYLSKKVKNKVQECSSKLGIHVNSIYPLINYHEEITQDDDFDLFILMALRDIVNFANDYAETLRSNRR
ncbi:interferon-induced protein 44-like [Hoplias malabaricus]|uniref:interferon-induced protein 44-like n=1 Tax=Hoplias malabaricus TaxID=27720 RepID=UPI00346255B2